MKVQALNGAVISPVVLLAELRALRTSIDALVVQIETGRTVFASDTPVELVKELAASEFAPAEPEWSRWMNELNRHEPKATARMAAMKACHEVLELKHTEVERLFFREHGSSWHAIKSINARCEYPLFRDRFAGFVRKVRMIALKL